MHSVTPHTQVDLTIRPMSLGDASLAARILNAASEQLAQRLGPGHWDQMTTPERVEQSARERDTYLIFAGDEPVATIAVSSGAQPFWPRKYWEQPRARALCVYGLAVLPDWQRQGVGAWTMRQAEKIAQAREIPYVRLDAYARDARSNAFYRSLGYQFRAQVTINTVCLNCYEKRVVPYP
jgi:ribosomal protein S18 acetylase RimI-like enzyme